MSGGTIGENARRRYRVRAVQTTRGIPVPRTSQLPTNPILAATAERSADRRISAGFIVEAATGAPDPHALPRRKRRTPCTPISTCLTIIQSYQRTALCCGVSKRCGRGRAPQDRTVRPGSLPAAASLTRRLHQRSVRGCPYRSLDVRPVCFATRASMRGPISSPSWKAKTQSGQPARVSVLWLPD